MLEEIGELTLTTAWKKVRGLIKDDPRYAKFSSSDRVTSKITAILFYSVDN
jgi:transcription elongation regulator 1